MFEVCVHLCGKELLPIYLGFNQFSAKKHIFLTTKDARIPIEAMLKRFLKNHQFEIREVAAFNPNSTRDAINALKLSNNVAFNLTGGTKLMFYGATKCEIPKSAQIFYINNNEVFNLTNDKQIELKKIQYVKDFIKIHMDCTKLIREETQNFNIQQAKIDFENFNNISKTPTHKIGHILERYIYAQVLELQNEGLPIYDLSLNYKPYLKYKTTNPMFPNKEIDGENVFNELDVAFSDGYRLYDIECKLVEEINSDFIEKLVSVAKFYGGNNAVKILATQKKTK